jgi:hypothetical protein
MHYTRVYSDSSGDTHFETVIVPLSDGGDIGYLSEKFDVKALLFRETKADYDLDFHTAPARQFIILLDGEIEITTSLGETMQFSAGEVLLMEDTAGKGHQTRHLKSMIRKSLFLQL